MHIGNRMWVTMLQNVGKKCTRLYHIVTSHFVHIFAPFGCTKWCIKKGANASNARKRAHHSPQVLLRFSTKRAEITDFRVLDKKAGGDLSRSHSAPSVMKRSHSAPSLTDLKGKLPHTPLVASDVHALRKHRGSFTDNHHNSSYQLSTESMTHKHSSFSRGNILDENPLRNSGSQRYEASL